MGRPYLRLELGGGEAAETHVGALFVVVPPPAFDPDLGLHPVPKPLEGQAFVPELPVWCEKAAEARSVLVESPK